MAHCRSRSLLICILVAMTPVAVLGQKSPIGPEFQVNAFTLGNQGLVAVAAEADGDFVIVWASGGNQDGYNYGVFARRFSSAGAPLASEFQVNTFTNAGQRVPSVAIDADGDFVVAWRGGSGGAYEIFASRFSSAGALLTGEAQINTFTTGEQLNPVVAAAGAGDFVVTWFSTSSQDGDTGGIFARRFASAGAPLGGEFQVNAYTIDYQRNVTVAATADGDFVVAWQSNLQDGSSWGVFARSFSSAGAAQTGEFQVNTYTTAYQGAPWVALDADGDFVVVWQSFYQDGYQYGTFAQRFSSAGVRLASEFRVSAYTTGGERNPSVAADADGDFVVAWHDTADPKDVFARRFSSAGVPLTGNFLVNTHTPQYQYRASVAASASGDFVVVWESNLQDGSNTGVFAQRFAAIAALDVDGNGALDPLTDGLLALRFYFGFTGNTLTTAAVGPMCTRCDATTISSYLTTVGLLLDIDGNGSTGPLTDGVLALRYLFGFSGASLTTGAIDMGACSRCTALKIEAYLAELIN